MIKKIIQSTYVMALFVGYAYMHAETIQMPPQYRNASPIITSILESPDTTVQQKLGQLIALPLIQVKGRGPTARAFGVALATLVESGAQLDEVIAYDGTTRFHMLVTSPNFDEGAAAAFFAYATPILGQNYVNALLSTPNAGGQTPLFFAAEKNASGLWYLLNRPASAATLNTQTKGGKTPLFKAAEVGNRASVIMLLEKNADITLPDNTGYTPYDIATKNNRGDGIATLIYRDAMRKKIPNFAIKYDPAKYNPN